MARLRTRKTTVPIMHHVSRWYTDPRCKMSVVLYIRWQLYPLYLVWKTVTVIQTSFAESKVHARLVSLVIRFSFAKTGSCESFEDVDFSCAGELKAVICSDVRELRFNAVLKWKKKETLEISRWAI